MGLFAHITAGVPDGARMTGSYRAPLIGEGIRIVLDSAVRRREAGPDTIGARTVLSGVNMAYLVRRST